MVGISPPPPPPIDMAALRARGPPPPTWLQGSVSPSVSGSVPPPQAGNPIAMGRMGPTGAMPPSFSSDAQGPAPHFPPMQMQFRPLQPPAQGYLSSSNPQFRAVGPPSIPHNMSVHPSNISGVGPSNIPSNATAQISSIPGPPSVVPNTALLPPSISRVGPPNVSVIQPPQSTQFPQGLPPSQGISFIQQRHMSGGPVQMPQQSQLFNLPPPGAVRVTPPPSFSLAASTAYSQSVGTVPGPFQPPNIRPVVQVPSSVTPWGPASTSSGAPQTGLTGQQNSLTVNSGLVPVPSLSSGSEWQEHIAPDGRRYYYNRITKHSSWDKPVELMTPLERAEASTDWKEFTTADGRKYYYNKVTKQSKWTMPEELKAAREQAERAANPALAPVTDVPTSTTAAAAASSSSPTLQKPIQDNSTAEAPSSSKPSSPGQGETEVAGSTSPAALEDKGPELTVSSLGDEDAVKSSETAGQLDIEHNVETKDASTKLTSDEASAQDIEEAKKAMPSMGKVNVTQTEVKPSVAAEEAAIYTSREEAKNAFRELLEAVHVESDWTWEYTMRLIINDKRYGALKSLNERKQAFSEYLAHRKKQEAEERRVKQKKAREEFVVMMQESKELNSRMRWSKVVSLLGDDPRFRAVEKDHERQDLFEDYALELEAKEKERAREERNKNLVEYRKFLESCDFIKAGTQWRKVVDKLADNESYVRLDKEDRIEVFQEYVRDLQKAEDEEKKILKEQQRRRERKNRDDFRKLMEDHRVSGLLHARMSWWDYLVLVKDLPEYVVVSSNTSGSSPKELFEDLEEDMEKELSENRARIKELLKIGKVDVTSEWTLDRFTAVLKEAGDVTGIPDSNLKIIFDDMLDRAKEREEKEAKRKKRAAEDFLELIRAEKSISVSSTWEGFKGVFENTVQFRAINDVFFCKTIFDEYVSELQQKAKEKERKREEEKAKKEEKEKERKREKERKEKERDKEKLVRKDREVNPEASDAGNNQVEKEERKKNKDKKDREKEKSKKHKRHHRSKNNEDISNDDDAKRMHRHSNEKKSSRKHGHEQSLDSEHRHKRHRKEQDQDGKSGRSDDLEDGEVGEDGEVV